MSIETNVRWNRYPEFDSIYANWAKQVLYCLCKKKKKKKKKKNRVDLDQGLIWFATHSADFEPINNW